MKQYNFLNKKFIKFLYVFVLTIGHVIADDCAIVKAAFELMSNEILENFNSKNINNCCDYTSIITCNGQDVIELKFENKKINLNDEVIKQLSKLPKLTSLEIRKADTGIPENFSLLKNLKSLAFEGNIPAHSLPASIPEDIGKLVTLEKLDLSDNRFSGKIPKSFGNLVNLKALDLGGNELEGKLPYELKNLKNLYSFSLNSNRGLTGYIPYFPNIVSCDYKDTNLCDLVSSKCLKSVKYSISFCTENDVKVTNLENGNPNPNEKVEWSFFEKVKLKNRVFIMEYGYMYYLFIFLGVMYVIYVFSDYCCCCCCCSSNRSDEDSNSINHNDETISESETVPLQDETPTKYGNVTIRITDNNVTQSDNDENIVGEVNPYLNLDDQINENSQNENKMNEIHNNNNNNDNDIQGNNDMQGNNTIPMKVDTKPQNTSTSFYTVTPSPTHEYTPISYPVPMSGALPSSDALSPSAPPPSNTIPYSMVPPTPLSSYPPPPGYYPVSVPLVPQVSFNPQNPLPIQQDELNKNTYYKYIQPTDNK